MSVVGDLVSIAAPAVGYAVGGDVGGAAGTALANYVGTQSTNQANADIASANNAWSADQFATRYQTTVKDMIAAGLNPMLAYSQGGGSPPTAQQVQFQNPVSSATQAYASMRGADSGASKNYSTANQADAMVKQIDASADKIRAEIDKLKGDTNFVAQQEAVRATAYMLKQQGDYYQERGISEGQQRALWQATIQNLQKDGTLKKLDIDAAESLGNLGRQSKELKPVIDVLLRVLSK